MSAQPVNAAANNQQAKRFAAAARSVVAVLNAPALNPDDTRGHEWKYLLGLWYASRYVTSLPPAGGARFFNAALIDRSSASLWRK